MLVLFFCFYICLVSDQTFEIFFFLSFISSAALVLTTFGGLLLIMDNEGEDANFDPYTLGTVLLVINGATMLLSTGLILSKWRKRSKTILNRISTFAGMTQVVPITPENDDDAAKKSATTFSAWGEDTSSANNKKMSTTGKGTSLVKPSTAATPPQTMDDEIEAIMQAEEYDERMERDALQMQRVASHNHLEKRLRDRASHHSKLQSLSDVDEDSSLKKKKKKKNASAVVVVAVPLEESTIWKQREAIKAKREAATSAAKAEAAKVEEGKNNEAAQKTQGKRRRKMSFA